MILSLDIGNSQLCGGIFKDDKLLLQFRYDTKQIGTSDQLGLFFKNVCRENNLDPMSIERIGVASVVPAVDYTVRAACIKYLNHTPLFLRPGVKTGIVIKTNNPSEVGADLVASVIAAKKLLPSQEILIFDLGTATTCCRLNKNGELTGVSISPGIKIMMNSLHSNTAKLLSVDIARPVDLFGKNTKAAMQSGVYYATLGLIEQLIKNDPLQGNNQATPIKTLGTGGFAYLYENTNLFDQIVPELVLIGIKEMLLLN